ncbi:hypothetical protein RND71_022219 [Anisodus tanguticus]|uniref:Uncharacterized protein n=1 Tax=Anisodus tanguticus TaxID=243964 RepID=A0AAE1RY40_9SOLA|nr:hypothetical protein RND71_022219 [Anisodus tanguticus]
MEECFSDPLFINVSSVIPQNFLIFTYLLMYLKFFALGLLSFNTFGLALAEEVSTPATTGIDVEISSLRKIEDGSVGKLEEAEKLFLSALQEAKEGFGDRDPHVASAYNNLAELYRVKKAFNKAEPMYLEAISILEESFGQVDVRASPKIETTSADEQSFLVQSVIALTDKRIPLHFQVLYLLGKYKDSDALVRDYSDIGGESMICTKRMRQLAEVEIPCFFAFVPRSACFSLSQNAELLDLVARFPYSLFSYVATHILQGWTSLEIVIAAELLALTLLSLGNLKEALAYREIAANLLHIARVKMLDSNKLHKSNVYQARAELDMAKDLLRKSISVSRGNLVPSIKEKGNKKSSGAPMTTVRSRQSALIILLQSLNALSLLEMTKAELEESKVPYISEAESALRECLSAYNEFVTEKSLSDAPGVKAEYLLCLKHLVDLISDNKTSSKDQSGNASLQELKDEIKSVEVELSKKGGRRS